MANRFSLGAPEEIAKFYGGDKQRILQALQSGALATIAPSPFDQTLAVAAGNFIDSRRAAQMQGSTNPPTVAQQVMGGAPATPPPPPSGGLGAAPPAAPPMAPMQPSMGMAPPMPEGPPMGMADGGLAMLPVPDAMFDEPTNGGFDDGYAGGGLVAFANGGDIDAERLRRALRMQESGGDYGIMNLEGSGAMGAYQFMPDTARALAKRAGLEYRPDLLAGAGGRSEKGRAYQERLMDEQMKDILNFAGGDVGRAGVFHFAGPNEEGWGPKTRKYKREIIQRYSGSKDDSADSLEQDYTTDNPLEVPAAPSIMDVIGQLGGYTGQRGGEKTRAYLEAAQLTPELREEMKRMNEAAAFAAAAGAFGKQGPFLSQLGTGAAEAARVLGEGKRGLREAELEGLKAAMVDEQQAYLDRAAMLDPAARFYTATMAPREAALGRRASATAAEEEREWRTNEAAKERAIRRELAELNVNPSDMETAVAILKDGTPEQKAALTEWLKMKQQYSPSGGGSWEDFGGTGGGSNKGSGNPAYKYQQ